MAALQITNACFKSECQCTTYIPNKAEPVLCDACNHLSDEHDISKESLATQIYQRVFGLNEVRPHHEKAVNFARKGHSIVLILPTGNGKSYCFWAPVLVTEGLAIIVEPLIALISDQLSRLNKYLKNTNYEAVAVSGEGQKYPGLYDIQEDDLFARLEKPAESTKEIKFIYTTAEKLSNWIAKKKFQKLMDLTKVNRIIFDEAYLLNEWSDFRPEHYQTLATITKSFPNMPYTLASALMTPANLRTLLKDLNLAPEVIIGDLSRPNLFINVRRAIMANRSSKEQSKDDLVYGDVIKLINKYKDDFGIIYCTSRNQCDNLLKKLVEMGVQKIDKYYGASQSSSSKRTSAENSATMDKWHRGEVKCMIATTAFGMGIDKPNVRYIVHWSMPDSPTSYYQQIGRAGRDGLPSECLMYFHYNHKKVIQKVKQAKGNSEREVRNMLRFCRDNYLCRHVQLSRLIGQAKLEPCYKMCDVCLRPGEKEPIEYNDFSDFAKLICEWIWKANNQKESLKPTLARLADALRNNKYELVIKSEELKDDLDQLKTNLKKIYGKKLRRDMHYDLLVEMVIRGFLLDEVSDNERVETVLSVEKEPDPDQIYEFEVPVPIPEVLVEMPEEPLKRGSKRKRTFFESFFERIPMAIVDPEQLGSDPENASVDDEEWEVEKFVDRNADYAQPYLKVKWKGSHHHTWEPEHEVRKNCDELYHDLRVRLEREGQWQPAPNIFQHLFYDNLFSFEAARPVGCSSNPQNE